MQFCFYAFIAFISFHAEGIHKELTSYSADLYNTPALDDIQKDEIISEIFTVFFPKVHIFPKCHNRNGQLQTGDFLRYSGPHISVFSWK